MSPTNSKGSKSLSGRKGKSKSKELPAHQVWAFKPKLQNEKVVLHSILDVYDVSYYDVIVNHMRDLITQLVRNHGFNDGSDRYKTIMLYTISLIEGREPENPGWLATSPKYRVPSKLGKEFCQLIADYFQVTEPSMKAKYYQVIITTLNIVRMVEGLVDEDLRSITNPASQIDQSLLDSFDKFCSKELVKYRNKSDRNINLFDIRFNIKKKGPNSVPKVESAIQEAIALTDSKLFRPFKIICQELNCNYLVDYLTLLTNDKKVLSDLSEDNVKQTSQSKTRTTNLRILASIPDKGFKSRLVAIVDFWTQLILEPFRSHIQFVIEDKFANADFRLDQDLGIAKMVDFQQRCLDCDKVEFKGKIHYLDAKHLKFYDITSWTDNLHRDLQKIAVSKTFSPRFAEAWAQLVVHCPWYHPKSGRTVKYGQGQGMGTNGSFDVATLTDHLLIKYVDDQGYDGLIHHISGYGKVGDDLWIYDPEDLIPKLYEKINLPINYKKSKTYCEIGSVAEFCARTYLNCTNVSRVSPNIISKSKRFNYIPLLLGVCASRGIQLDATSFQTLNNNVKGTEISYLDKLQDWLVSYILISQFEPSSSWKDLTLDYLTAGNWIKGELVKQVITDSKLRSRLLIAYSIVTILDNYEDLKYKLFDIMDAMEDYGVNILHVSSLESNLFDTESPHYNTANELTEGDVLTPKQIVVLGRYKDQQRAMQGGLMPFETLQSIEDPREIYDYSKEISELATRSCYDQGNLNYDTESIISVQYKIVKVLRSMSDDCKIIYGISSEQLRLLWQDLPYNEIAEKWEDLMPIISADPAPT